MKQPYILSRYGQIKKSFDRLFDSYKVWGVYIRRDLSETCPLCVEQEGSGQGKYDCPKCFGTGYICSVSKMPYMISRQKPASFSDAEEKPGLISGSTTRLYFKREHQPKQADLLLEVSWNVPYEKVPLIGNPTEILHVFFLENVEASYEGPISYFSAGGEIQDHRIDGLYKGLKWG